MTSPTRKPSLDDVLDEFFYSTDKPQAALIVRACEAHPEYRNDILEFAALWSAYEAAPEPSLDPTQELVDEDSVSRLQSYVLNQVYEADIKPQLVADVDSARLVLSGLAGATLRRTAAMVGLGGCTLLLQKVVTNSIRDVPEGVCSALATHLRIVEKVLITAICSAPTPSRSFRSRSAPEAFAQESWEAAVDSLGLEPKERERLLALQTKRQLVP